MTLAEKKSKLVNQLIAHYQGDKSRVKALGDNCKMLGFSLSEEANIDSISNSPEAFFTLMTFSDFGVLDKIEEVLNILKGKE